MGGAEAAGPVRARAAVRRCTRWMTTAPACTRLNTTPTDAAAGAAGARRRRRWIRRRRRAPMGARRPQHLLHAGRQHLPLAVGRDRPRRRCRRRCRSGGGRGGAADAADAAARLRRPPRQRRARVRGASISPCAWRSTSPPNAAGVRRGLARDEESLLRSQDARRQLGRREGQVRIAAGLHRRYRRTAQRDHGDDRRHERFAHRHFRRHAPARPSSAEERVQTRYPGFDHGAGRFRFLQSVLHLPQGSRRSRIRQAAGRRLRAGGE